MLHNESMEMYLETILRLCKSNEKVRAVDIANQMRISKVSVCHAIKNLQAKDYVTYESRLIRLTKKGRYVHIRIQDGRACKPTCKHGWRKTSGEIKTKFYLLRYT